MQARETSQQRTAQQRTAPPRSAGHRETGRGTHVGERTTPPRAATDAEQATSQSARGTRAAGRRPHGADSAGTPRAEPGRDGGQLPPQQRESLRARLKWTLLRGLTRTVGRSSRGLALGYRYGFDSGPLLDYVYENEAHGSFGLGRVLDRAFLDALVWRSARSRHELLKEVVRKQIDERAAAPEVVVLDVAAGTGRYLLDLLEEHEGPEASPATPGEGPTVAEGGQKQQAPDAQDAASEPTASPDASPGPRLRVVCRDASRTALAYGRRLAAVRRLLEHELVYEEGDALAPAPLDEGRAPDLIVVAGYYELLADDDSVRRSLARLRELLAPGGALVLTTQTNHPHHEFATHVLPNRRGGRWRTTCRSVAAVEELAVAAGFPADGITSREEETELSAVLVARE